MSKVTVAVATYPDDPHVDRLEQELKLIGVPYILENKEQKKSFAENNNAAARKVETPYVLFLNSDVYTNGEGKFIEVMATALENDPQAGAVGALIIFSRRVDKTISFMGKAVAMHGTEGKVQHAGVVLNQNLLPIEYGRNKDRNDAVVQNSRYAPAVTGACMMVRKDQFLDLLGGFDEDFINGWEDVDLCFRYLEQGFYSYYAAEAVIYHYFGGSENHGRYALDAHNFEHCYKKWYTSGRAYNLFFGIPKGIDKIDVSCGSRKKAGFFGLDKHKDNGIVDYEFDLDRIGIENVHNMPFGDSSIKELYCGNVLGQVSNQVAVMNEFHRIVSSEGILELIVPNGVPKSPLAKSMFTPETFTEFYSLDGQNQNPMLLYDNQRNDIAPWYIESLTVEGGYIHAVMTPIK
jgi:hypothetical protein